MEKQKQWRRMRGGEEGGTCWGSCHVVWGLCYVAAGAVQLVAGLFALFSLPVLGLGTNIWTGAWNMAAGITSALLAGLVNEVSTSRQELLLYTSLSVLGVNTANLVLLEAGEWSMLLQDTTRSEIAHRGLSRLVLYARVSTTVSTVLVLAMSLLDAHVSYCLLQTKHRQVGGRHRVLEPVTDVEYVIPRKKTQESEDVETTTNRVQNQNAQSWVFDTGPTDGSYIQSTHLDTMSLGGGSDSASEEPNSYLLSHGSPPAIVVKVEPAPVEDRTLNHMKSFSRTPSPTFSLSHHPQYEIVPDDSPARTRLYTADYIYHQRTGDTRRTHRRCESVDNRPHSASSIHHTGAAVVEKFQYASLMLELEQAIQSKRPVNESSPSSSSDPSSSQLKDSDTEFSKELEAALQLLQDLGSPNVIETPTEPNRTVLDKPSRFVVNEQEQHDDGKLTVSHSRKLDLVSASSSGYSSPSAPGSSMTQLCTISSGPALACMIRNEGPRAIVSLYPSETIEQRNGVTTIAIRSPSVPPPPPPIVPQPLSNPTKLVTFHPEFANAIYENESLVYLSELELLARHWRLKAERRLSEQRAHHQVLARISVNGAVISSSDS